MKQRANRACVPVSILLIVFNLISVLRAAEEAVEPTGAAKQAAGSAASESSAIQELREQLAEQRKQLDEMKLLLLDQKRQIDSLKTQASTVAQEDVPASVKPMR